MRTLLGTFEIAFDDLDKRGRELIMLVGPEMLYERPSDDNRMYAVASVGEAILRSAAVVEIVFNGLTTRMWDDPFEWTLPEKLSTPELVIEYLDETVATRKRGFAFLQTDGDLQRSLPAPIKMLTIAEILVDALAKAEHFEGRASAIYEILTAKALPRR